MRGIQRNHMLQYLECWVMLTTGCADSHVGFSWTQNILVVAIPNILAANYACDFNCGEGPAIVAEWINNILRKTEMCTKQSLFPTYRLSQTLFEKDLRCAVHVNSSSAASRLCSVKRSLYGEGLYRARPVLHEDIVAKTWSCDYRTGFAWLPRCAAWTEWSRSRSDRAAGEGVQLHVRISIRMFRNVRQYEFVMMPVFATLVVWLFVLLRELCM